jgi:trehalose utilization protein
MRSLPRVTVWNEFRHERRSPEVAAIYPDGMHEVIAGALRAHGMEVNTATLDEPQHGLDSKRLASTDVLIWWGHMAHEEVADAIVERIHQRVLEGMGLIVLHSSHFSKIFRRLMGTSCDLKWRNVAEKERIWLLEPGHPIAEGLSEYIEIPNAEAYGEPFDIPAPETLVFVSWFQGGEVFRSGCCYRRGNGKIFYFRPGHETYPIFHQPDIQQVLRNAVIWAAPSDGPDRHLGHHPDPLEDLDSG